MLKGINREDFPTLDQKINGHPLAYLDNGASAQKPTVVLEAMDRFYRRDYANVHRGVHTLSARATDIYEATREKVRAFLNAEHEDEIVFTRGTTDGMNLIATSWGEKFLKAGDEVLITALEHHANIVPWQLLRDKTGIKLVVAPITDKGEVRIEDIAAKITPRTKLVSVAHVSNVLGTVLPVKEIAALAHQNGALCLVDGAQGACHAAVDVHDIDADFYVFSAHKLYGPTGIGALYGKQAILKDMPPYQGGGDMIASVSFEETIFKAPPYRFEAGTPPIVETIGMGSAIDYVMAIGMERVAKHEDALLKLATKKLEAIEGVRILGRAAQKSGVLSFVMDCAHPHDIGTILDNEGVAVRAGHHCAQPLMDVLGVPATVRASFALYNDEADIEALASALRKVREIFG
jgi:cysteine desulfurase/selenocysteine lyase